MAASKRELMDEWYKCVSDFMGCDGFKLQSRIRKFQLSLSTFNGNFQEINRTIAAMGPEEELADRTVFEFGDRTLPVILEICRCLHNFVAAAMTLVDQTRILYREVYKPDGLITEYDQEIEKRFRENGLHQFIQGMRNMTLHCRLPNVTYSEPTKITMHGITVTRELYFTKKDLLDFSNWNPHARSFLLSQPEKVALPPIVRDYHHQVAAFHEWFSLRQRESHASQLDHVERLEADMRRIAAELKDWDKK